MLPARLRGTLLCGLICLALASCDESQLTPPNPAPPGDTTGPSVVSVAPSMGATGVQGATTVRATFSERLQPSTVTTSTFTVSNSAPVSGSVTVTDSIGVFSPATPLDPNTVYTARITTGVRDLAGNALASDYVWTFTTGAPADTVRPIVVDVSPANNATGVVVSTTVRATFSELMDGSSFDSGTLVVTGPSGAVPGTVALDGAVASFTPSSPLQFDTLYEARVTTDAKDLAGNGLASDFVFHFTTAPAPDVTRPEVQSVQPLSTEIDVDVGTLVKATFTEAMDPATITTATFRLATGATQVAGTVTLTDFTATFHPSSSLAPSTLFTATVTTGVEDLAGNNLASNYVWQFTTAAPPDVTPPTVSATNPVDGATSVASGTTVTVTFSEPMDSTSVNGNTFRLSSTLGSVSGSVSIAGNVATFTPTSALLPLTVYTARITTGAQDRAGNNLAAEFSWTFTTAVAPDLTPPTVQSVLPASNATDVAHGTTVQATFSEPVKASSVTASSFTLTGPGGAVAGSRSASGSTATFTPSAPLAANTSYTARVTTGVTDLAGNPLGSDFVWTFTTAPPPDTTPPTVTSRVPAAGATGVAPSSPVQATFSEAMAPASITTTTFTLQGGAGAVSGSVSLSGLTATFTPAGPLAYGTTYTATVTTGAEDLAGNNLAQDAVWTFTTADPPDATPPIVTGTTPVDGAPSVDVDATIRATFSEDLLPSSVNATTMTLTGGSGAVSASVTLSGTVASLRPVAPLEYATTYTAKVSTGVQDVAGNHLAADFTWSFTTQPAPDTTGPTVGTVLPANGASGVDVATDVSATFSEPVAAPSVNAASFTLDGAGVGAVTGTVSLAGETATFHPTSPLANATTYTARITTGVEDLAGNPLASEFTWSFATQAPPDTTAPTVGSVAPADGAQLVAMNTNIAATFSESIDPASITATTFTLSGPSGAVTGVRSVSGSTATLNPSADLTANTVYTATLTTGVRDLDGNPLEAPFVWSFTTTHLAPIADAGPDQTVGVATTVQLDGTGSSDPEGQPLTYVWNQTRGDPVNGGQDLTGPTPTFTAPLLPQRLDFQLRVSDGTLTSGPDRVRVDVVLVPISSRTE